MFDAHLYQSISQSIKFNSGSLAHMKRRHTSLVTSAVFYVSSIAVLAVCLASYSADYAMLGFPIVATYYFIVYLVDLAVVCIS